MEASRPLTKATTAMINNSLLDSAKFSRSWFRAVLLLFLQVLCSAQDAAEGEKWWRLVSWNEIHTRQDEIHNKPIVMDGFLEVVLTENAANFRLWADADALRLQRIRQSVLIDRHSMVTLLGRAGLRRLEWQFLNGAFVELSGTFKRLEIDDNSSHIGDFSAVDEIVFSRGRLDTAPIKGGRLRGDQKQPEEQ